MDTKQARSALGVVIRQQRIKLGHSQESLGEIAELHRNYIGSIERGERNVSLDNLVRIASALGLPLSTLIALAEAHIATSNMRLKLP